MDQGNPLTCEVITANDAINYYIPLAPFECLLISELEKFLDTSSEAAALLPQGQVHIQCSFNDWMWTDRMRELEKEFEEENLREQYDGDKKAAYSEFMSFMGRKEGGLELARVRRIQKENEAFTDSLGDMAIKNLEFSPVFEDLASWKTISRIYEFCGRRWKAKTIGNPHGAFEIWKLVHMFTISWKNRGNKSTALDLLLEQDQFWESFHPEVEDNEEDETEDEWETDFDRPIQFYFCPTTEVEQVPPSLPKSGNNEEITSEDVDYLLRQAGRRKEVNDPRGYVHVISWTELQHIEPEQLLIEGIDIEIPFHESPREAQWVLWTPPHQGIAWSHQLFTEEEVFGYSILKDWKFPDHALHGKVVFAMHKIETTNFIPNLFKYWDNWNDCAITQESSGSPLLLLETIPGLRFRSRLKNQDRTAARSYFRNLVEAHATGTLNASVIRDILGPEGYSPQYEHALRVIQFDQLSGVDWDTPLGRGANGAVYAATWDRPASVLTSTKSVGLVEVVLKEIISRKGQNKGLTKEFLKELDSTFTSLSGLAVCCVEFLGITAIDDGARSRSKTNGILSDRSQNEMQGGSKILLVFERATQGTLPKFLENHLSGIEFVECWDRTADALSSIAAGIKTLHQSHVLHRDLHLNNVLVTDRYFPHDLGFSHEYQYLLSDLGEGKVMRDEPDFNQQTAHHASYGAIDPRAPEVHGNSGWSTAAELFSYGVVTCKILDLRSRVSSAKPPQDILDELEQEFPALSQDAEMIAMIVPAHIREAVEPCLAHLPEDRPSIGNVSHVLNRLLTSFTADRMYPEDGRRVQWTYWDWNRSLREGRSGKAGADSASQAKDVFAELEDVS